MFGLNFVIAGQRHSFFIHFPFISKWKRVFSFVKRMEKAIYLFLTLQYFCLLLLDMRFLYKIDPVVLMVMNFRNYVCQHLGHY